MHFINGELNYTLVHPLGNLQLLNEFILDVVDDLITEVFRFGRESFLDEKAA